MPLVRPIPFLVTIDRVATGGTGIATAPDGRVMLVRGGLPGDVVEVVVTKEKKRYLEGSVGRVVERGPARVDPTCAHFVNKCGGCDWQNCAPEAASDFRHRIVLDSLRRLGHLEGVDVRSHLSVGGRPLAIRGYRTTVRAAIKNGSAGFRQGRSNDIVTIDSCETAHPAAERILVEGEFPGASEIVVRVGERTGEALVVVDGPPSGISNTVVPVGTQVVGRSELHAGKQAWIHEEVAGRLFRISADSFFQCRPDGAEALIELAAEAIEGIEGPLVDAYGGVGLFGATLGAERKVTLVESNISSVRDAKLNLKPADEILQSRVETWKPTPAAVVIADPARRGLMEAGVGSLVATRAKVIALISCDPAALARDARLLVDEGFSLDWVRTVDLFGQTSHVETVSRFSR